MEQMSHARSTRKKTTAKSSVTVSVIIHGLIFLAGAYWAAHEGMLGQKMKDLSATIMDKEKKEVKKDEPKAEERKAAAAREQVRRRPCDSVVVMCINLSVLALLLFHAADPGGAGAQKEGDGGRTQAPSRGIRQIRV